MAPLGCRGKWSWVLDSFVSPPHPLAPWGGGGREPLLVGFQFLVSLLVQLQLVTGLDGGRAPMGPKSLLLAHKYNKQTLFLSLGFEIGGSITNCLLEPKFNPFGGRRDLVK